MATLWSGEVNSVRFRLSGECMEVYLLLRIAGGVGKFRIRRRGRSFGSFGRRSVGGWRVEGCRRRKIGTAGNVDMRRVRL